MTIKRKIIYILVLLALIFLSTCFYFSAHAFSSKAEWEEITIGEYTLGNEFSVPSRYVTVNGEQYNAKATVKMPDGTSTSAKLLVLQQPGLYTIQYFVEIDGDLYIKEECFSIRHTAYNFSDTNTEVYALEEGGYKYSPNTEGLFVSVQADDKVTVQQIIDLPKEDEDILLAKFFVAPTEQGVLDCRRVRIVFTDIYDEESYMQVVFNGNWYEEEAGNYYGGSYVLAGGAGQDIKAYYNGTLTNGGGYGAYVYGGFYAYDTNKKPIDPATIPMEIYFNPATCQITVKDNYVNKMKTIIDTDNPDYYGNNLWEGFKSGKIRMSIYAEQYVSTAANLVFTYIKDVNLKEKYCEDDFGPDIFVDSDYEIQNMPEARVGKYYKIPSARAIDVFSGECEVKTYVFFNYPSEHAYLKQIENGKFLVDESGQYAIIYRAIDNSNNLTEYVIPVHAGDEIDDIEIDLSYDIISNVSVGNEITLPFASCSGGSGETSLVVSACCGEEKYFFDNSMDVWCFRPNTVGEWTITYLVEDFTGYTYQEEFIINVEKLSLPLFVNEPVLAPVYLDGFSYEIPEVKVYDFTGDELVNGKAYAEITDANGVKKYNPQDKFIPTVDNNGDYIKILYKYDYADGMTISTEEFSVPVVCGFSKEEYKILNIRNYFYSDNINFTCESNEVDFTEIFTVQRNGNSSWTFANALTADEFSIDFKTFKKSNQYSAILIKLTDAKNPNITLTAKMFKGSDGKFNVNIGDKTLVLSEDFDSDNLFTLKFDKNKVIFDNTRFAVVEKDDFGKDFSGFISNKVYLTFSLENAIAGDKYELINICGHSIGNFESDAIAPEIQILGKYGGSISSNEKYVISPADALDVISPNVNLYLSVFDSNDNLVVDDCGVLLDEVDGRVSYSIKFDKPGQYKVVYTAFETYEETGFSLGISNEGTFEYFVYAKDDVAPSITLTSQIPTYVSQGSSVKLPNYIVSDNFSAGNKISVRFVVSNPYGRIENIVGNSFKCEVFGEYQLRIIVLDEKGNTTMLTYSIFVGE